MMMRAIKQILCYGTYALQTLCSFSIYYRQGFVGIFECKLDVFINYLLIPLKTLELINTYMYNILLH